MKPKKDPEQSLLLALFEYRSGMLFCKVIRSQKKAGDRAGYLDKNTGYRVIGIEGKLYVEHRLIWIMHHGPIPDGFLIDHKDTLRANNEISNLRLATESQNKSNSSKSSANSSGFKGVSKQGSKWKAEIRVNYGSKYLGMHNTPEEAHEAYKAASIKYFGEFAHE